MTACGGGEELKRMKSFSSILGSQKRIPQTEKSRIGNKRLLFRDKDNFSLKSQLIELKITGAGEQEISMRRYRAAVFPYISCNVLPLKSCTYAPLVKLKTTSKTKCGQ